MNGTRRDFLRTLGVAAAGVAAGRFLPAPSARAATATRRPNVILCMSDDQGWGDTGYNGHEALLTPNLDAMSRAGLRFDRWYAAAPVCSPTRGSCITGRHPSRYGITLANDGHMKREEFTLAEALKTQGYATGHFGKWHLGTLTTKERDGNRGRPGADEDYSTPAMNGFDEYFSTESKVPTWNPMKTPGSEEPYGTSYWTGEDRRATENLEGDDSRVIMDRAEPFLRRAAAAGTPFFACIWFHAPHLPCVAGPRYLELYRGRSEEEAHYYGCITAMDEQVGRLRRVLRELRVADDTMLWFCSDNGPEGRASAPGRTGPFRGRKRSLYEGGIRVPGLLEWPGMVRQARRVAMPCCTSDYFPTVLDLLGFSLPDQPGPLDGVSLRPLIAGAMSERPLPIGFQYAGQAALAGERYKIVTARRKRRGKARGKAGGASGPRAPGGGYELYDLLADPGEKNDIAAGHPEVVATMSRTLEDWRASCKRSRGGADYR